MDKLEQDVREIRADVKDVLQRVNDIHAKVEINKVKSSFWGILGGLISGIVFLISGKFRGWF